MWDQSCGVPHTNGLAAPSPSYEDRMPEGGNNRTHSCTCAHTQHACACATVSSRFLDFESCVDVFALMFRWVYSKGPHVIDSFSSISKCVRVRIWPFVCKCLTPTSRACIVYVCICVCVCARACARVYANTGWSSKWSKTRQVSKLFSVISTLSPHP